MQTDPRIETAQMAIYRGNIAGEQFARAFTDLIREYIDGCTPFIDVEAIHYAGRGADMLNEMGLPFTCYPQHCEDFPIGAFEFLPDATCAVSIHYGEDLLSHMTPGVTPTDAIFAALLQVCREKHSDNRQMVMPFPIH